MAKKKLTVKLVRSVNKALPSHKACVRGLGLRRLHQTVVLTDHPAIRGMINKVNYLVTVVEGA